MRIAPKLKVERLRGDFAVRPHSQASAKDRLLCAVASRTRGGPLRIIGKVGLSTYTEIGTGTMRAPFAQTVATLIDRIDPRYLGERQALKVTSESA